MSGSLYIWIIGTFFVLTVGVVGVLASLMWLGHWAERKETGARHGFLELPMELRKEIPEVGAESGDGK